MKIAVYPGSFDPMTNGHLDILKRAASLFDHVIVGVLVNNSKKCLFSPEERVDMINEATHDLENVRVMHFNGLLVDFCDKVGATAIIRGLRAVSDYEYEVQMFAANYKLNPKVETIFLMSQPKYSFLSSSVVKEIAFYGGHIEDMVTPAIADAIKKRMKK
ncbi:MAG: pantetheine-phosphate adenylyltransferase [Candidatus Riflebacteria bacterium]|nr:pantetheine-phosphate adenylyltransferase [Candidatus Riflebacteria bacterium]